MCRDQRRDPSLRSQSKRSGKSTLRGSQQRLIHLRHPAHNMTHQLPPSTSLRTLQWEGPAAHRLQATEMRRVRQTKAKQGVLQGQQLPSISSSSVTDHPGHRRGAGMHGSKMQPLRVGVPTSARSTNSPAIVPHFTTSIQNQSSDITPCCKHLILPLLSTSRCQGCTKSFIRIL